MSRLPARSRPTREGTIPLVMLTPVQRLQRQPPIDMDELTGDVAGVARQQERNDGRDLIG